MIELNRAALIDDKLRWRNETALGVQPRRSVSLEAGNENAVARHSQS